MYPWCLILGDFIRELIKNRIIFVSDLKEDTANLTQIFFLIILIETAIDKHYDMYPHCSI